MDYRQAVLSEIVAVMEQGADVTLDQIETGLSEIYAQYQGDQWVTNTLTAVWAKVQLMAAGTDKAVALAAVAREMAEQMKAQRDVAIRAMVETKAAADRLDRNHPIIDAVAEGLEEQMAEEMEFASGYSSMWQSENMRSVAGLNISSDEAATFLSMLTDDALDNIDPTIAAELRARIGKFIRKMVIHYDAAASVWAEQHPYTMLVEEGER